MYSCMAALQWLGWPPGRPAARQPGSSIFIGWSNNHFNYISEFHLNRKKQLQVQLKVDRGFVLF